MKMDVVKKEGTTCFLVEVKGGDEGESKEGGAEGEKNF